MMETLKIDPLLPPCAKQELYDFYQFLVSKYVPKNQNMNTENIQSLRGVFSKYADSSKIALEDKAWEMHVIRKYKDNSYD